MTAYTSFQQHIAEYNDLLNILNILKWDMRTKMPKGGAETRGQQLATLSTIAKNHFVSDKTARLLDNAMEEVAHEDPNSYRVRAVQHTRHYYDIQKRIPVELVSQIAELSPKSEAVWAEAKQNNDFASFQPYLEQMLVLKQQMAEAIGYPDHPYDALLYEFEPTMTATTLTNLLTQLRQGLQPLLQQILDNPRPLEVDLWQYSYPIEKQKAFALEIAEQFGYDFQRGRLDIAPHPFEVSFTRNDVRIATRYGDYYLPMSIFATFHETGHALYEQNIDPVLTRTALTTDFLGQYAVGGTSYGAHECSSRLWEYPIGHSRAFWYAHFPRLKAYFPEQLGSVDAEYFYRAVNYVQPSLIHIDSDEVTYNLHIIVRVEIEMGLLDGTYQIKDLPEIWGSKMQEYVGVAPDNDREGVLQDAHWSAGGFGSFPGYTIGNVMSSQLLAKAHQDIPTLDHNLELGNYQPLLNWLITHVYRHGRTFNITELLQQISDSELQVEPYLNYLQEKYQDIYQISYS